MRAWVRLCGTAELFRYCTYVRYYCKCIIVSVLLQRSMSDAGIELDSRPGRQMDMGR